MLCLNARSCTVLIIFFSLSLLTMIIMGINISDCNKISNTNTEKENLKLTMVSLALGWGDLQLQQFTVNMEKDCIMLRVGICQSTM